MLALAWGVVATWWVGALLGIALAIAARTGSLPRIEASALHGSVLRIVLVMAACALLSGVIGWQLAKSGVLVLVGPVHDQVPEDRHVQFIAMLWAHVASY